MAKSYKMGTWSLSSIHGQVSIPGGWHAHIPSVSLVYQSDKKHLTDHFVNHGHQYVQAVVETELLVQEIFASNWIRGLRNSICRWAAEYMGMFPEAYDNGKLTGFNPELLAPWFVPFGNAGKAGRPEVRELMTKMWEEATYVREV